MSLVRALLVGFAAANLAQAAAHAHSSAAAAARSRPSGDYVQAQYAAWGRLVQEIGLQPE